MARTPHYRKVERGNVRGRERRIKLLMRTRLPSALSGSQRAATPGSGGEECGTSGGKFGARTSKVSEVHPNEISVRRAYNLSCLINALHCIARMGVGWTVSAGHTRNQSVINKRVQAISRREPFAVRAEWARATSKHHSTFVDANGLRIGYCSAMTFDNRLFEDC